MNLISNENRSLHDDDDDDDDDDADDADDDGHTSPIAEIILITSFSPSAFFGAAVQPVSFLGDHLWSGAGSEQLFR